MGVRQKEREIIRQIFLTAAGGVGIAGPSLPVEVGGGSELESLHLTSSPVIPTPTLPTNP